METATKALVYHATINTLKSLSGLGFTAAAGALWDDLRRRTRTVSWKNAVQWIKATEEIGDEGRYHIHAVCKANCTFEELRELFPPGTHFEVKSSKKEIEEALEYISDEEEETKYEAKAQVSQRTVSIGAVPSTYRGRDVIKTEQLYEWQSDLVKELEYKPDNRKIIWYVDEDGCNGKSALLKYLVHHCGIAWSAGGGSLNDIAFAASSSLHSTNSFVIDYPRHVDMEEDINYDALEKFKDGLMTINKYKSHNATFKPKHVVVFANSEPDITKMSDDRWDIRRLKNKMIVKQFIFHSPKKRKLSVTNVEGDVSSLDLHQTPTKKVRNVEEERWLEHFNDIAESAEVGGRLDKKRTKEIRNMPGLSNKQKYKILKDIIFKNISESEGETLGSEDTDEDEKMNDVINLITSDEDE